jgi:hypothetical protein
MSETLSFESELAAITGMQILEREQKMLEGDFKVVDSREDAAYSIALLLMGSDLVVRVLPKNAEEMPFSLCVAPDEAAEVYAHPFAYSDRPAA